MEKKVEENKIVKFISILVKLFLTGLIYYILIIGLTRFFLLVVSDSIENMSVNSDPIILLAFTIGLMCTIITIFITRVPVYKYLGILQNKINIKLKQSFEEKDKKNKGGKVKNGRRK